MELRLDGQVALITGGSRGIGLAIGRSFVEAGARVVLTSRHRADLDSAVGDFPPDTADALACNAGEPDAAETCVRYTIERFGRIDILVNNAGTNPAYGPIADVELGRINKTIDVNARAPLLFAQRAWHHGMSTHGGVIINVSSMGAYLTSPGVSVYAMTKAALVHLTHQLALELAPAVRVVGIAPGLVETAMSAGLTNRAEMEARLPMRRIGQPSDVANLALFLASDAASWLTGQTILIDGGGTLR